MPPLARGTPTAYIPPCVLLNRLASRLEDPILPPVYITFPLFLHVLPPNVATDYECRGYLRGGGSSDDDDGDGDVSDDGDDDDGGAGSTEL